MIKHYQYLIVLIQHMMFQFWRKDIPNPVYLIPGDIYFSEKPSKIIFIQIL